MFHRRARLLKFGDREGRKNYQQMYICHEETIVNLYNRNKDVLQTYFKKFYAKCISVLF